MASYAGGAQSDLFDRLEKLHKELDINGRRNHQGILGGGCTPQPPPSNFSRLS